MTKKQQQAVYRAQVEGVLEAIGMGRFGIDHEHPVEEDDEGCTIFLKASDTTISFAELDKLAKAFKTKKINFGGGYEQTGYCESCADTSPIMTIAIHEAVLG